MQRPENFRIDYTHPLARGLVYANFGRINSSNYYMDESLYKNHGVGTNLEPVTDWKFDSTINRFGIELDGDNEYIELGTINVGNKLMLNEGIVCICAWVNQHSGGDQFQRIIDKSDNGSALNGYSCWMDAPNRQYGLSVNNNNWRTTDTNVYDYSTWTHTIGIFSSTNIDCYINSNNVPGSFYVGSIAPIPNTATNARIGTWNHSDAREFDGMIADIMIYNRLLDNIEIKILSDIDNVMYSGLLKYPKRKYYVVPAIVPSRRFKVGKLLVRG